MKKTFTLIFLISALVTSTFAFSAQNKNCGQFKGHKIVAYGGMSCQQAKRVYTAFERGHTPKGWTCGQSVGGCGKGKMGFTFKLN